MIKNVVFILALTGLAACGNRVSQADAPGIENNKPAEKIATADADPICQMSKEAGWTDYAIKAPGDTVWFCSATCKDAYMAKNK